MYMNSSKISLTYLNFIKKHLTQVISTLSNFIRLLVLAIILETDILKTFYPQRNVANFSINSIVFSTICFGVGCFPLLIFSLRYFQYLQPYLLGIGDIV